MKNLFSIRWRDALIGLLAALVTVALLLFACGIIFGSRESFSRPAINYSKPEVVRIHDAGHASTTKGVTISPDNFSTKIESIPPLKSLSEIDDVIASMNERIRPLYEQDEYYQGADLIKQYPTWAGRFLPDDNITSIEAFDVDEDGKPETIIGLCEWGNHCPHQMYVVKGSRIIFSATDPVGDGIGIEEDQAGNGFYVEWKAEDQVQTYCCPSGYMKTKFIYKEGSFMPISEERISL